MLQNLSEIDKGNQYILYTDKDDLEQVLPSQKNFSVQRLRCANYAVWEQILLPLQAQKDGINILHCTGNTAPIWLPSSIRLVITIHDVMYLKKSNVVPGVKSLYQKMGRIYRGWVVPRIVYNADKVVTISNFSKEEIIGEFPKLQNGDLTVIYEAANRQFKQVDSVLIEKIKNKFNIRSPYVFTLGAIDPRKNTKRILENYIALRESNSIPFQLVISGVPKWEKTEYYTIWQRTRFREDIIFTSFVEEVELVALYNGALMFLYPSLYEGFGLPPLEAMLCGTPVITSNVTSIPEIVGQAAILVDPLDNQGMQTAISSVMHNDALRQQLVFAGLIRAKDFSWLRMAKETLDVYREVLERYE